MTKWDCPCYGCKERTSECHPICERFKAWEKEYAKERERIKKIKAADREFWERKKDAMYRMVARIHRNEV